MTMSPAVLILRILLTLLFLAAIGFAGYELYVAYTTSLTGSTGTVEYVILSLVIAFSIAGLIAVWIRFARTQRTLLYLCSAWFVLAACYSCFSAGKNQAFQGNPTLVRILADMQWNQLAAEVQLEFSTANACCLTNNRTQEWFQNTPASGTTFPAPSQTCSNGVTRCEAVFAEMTMETARGYVYRELGRAIGYVLIALLAWPLALLSMKRSATRQTLQRQQCEMEENEQFDKSFQQLNQHLHNNTSTNNTNDTMSRNPMRLSTQDIMVPTPFVRV